MVEERLANARDRGVTHKKLRRLIARDVNAGREICARCGERIARGEDWYLVERDRPVVEHVRCNRAISNQTRRRRHSRSW